MYNGFICAKTNFNDENPIVRAGYHMVEWHGTAYISRLATRRRARHALREQQQFSNNDNSIERYVRGIIQSHRSYEPACQWEGIGASAALKSRCLPLVTHALFWSHALLFSNQLLVPGITTSQRASFSTYQMLQHKPPCAGAWRAVRDSTAAVHMHTYVAFDTWGMYIFMCCQLRIAHSNQSTCSRSTARLRMECYCAPPPYTPPVNQKRQNAGVARTKSATVLRAQVTFRRYSTRRILSGWPHSCAISCPHLYGADAHLMFEPRKRWAMAVVQTAVC